MPEDWGMIDRRIDWAKFRERGHKYAIDRWGMRRDLRYLHHDDLRSLADYALAKLLSKPGDEIDYVLPGGAFWNMLRNGIDWGVARITRVRDNDPGRVWSYDDDTGSDFEDEDPARSYPFLQVVGRESLMLTTIADHIATSFPTPLKAILALRFFEQLELSEVAEIIGCTDAAVTSWTKAATHNIVDFARNQTLENPIEVRGLTKLQHATREAVVSNVGAWVGERHGVDLSSWLGWAQICYRTDVSYIVDMIRVGNGNRLVVPGKLLHDRDADLEAIEALDPPPRSIPDVKARLGWTHNRAQEMLMIWRTKHPEIAIRVKAA